MVALAVRAMAEHALPTDSSTSQRPLHPFFAPNRQSVPPADVFTIDETPTLANNRAQPSDPSAADRSEDDVAESATKQGKRRKADEELPNETLRKTRPRKRTRNSAGGGIADHFVKLQKGDDEAQRKPGHAAGSDAVHATQTGAPSSSAAHEVDLLGSESLAGGSNPEGTANSQSQAVPNGRFPEFNTQHSTAVPDSEKTKQLLRFDPRTGTISPLREPKDHACAQRPPVKRGRKPAPKIVRITYRKDGEACPKLGELIDSIMGGQTRHSATASAKSGLAKSTKSPPKATKTSAPKSSKATHPFFLAQPKKPDPIPEDSKAKEPTSSPRRDRTKQYTSTPCSPRKPRTGSAAKAPIPQFGIQTSGLKIPGLQPPAWPCRGMVHVRGNDWIPVDVENNPLPLPSRKSKGNAVKVSPNESIITLAAQSMQITAVAETVRNIDTNKTVPPPPELRLPQKHFESGSKLRTRILPELRTFQASSASKKSVRKSPAQDNEDRVQPCPQLARLYGTIASSLSAFDMSLCETTNWVQKYAPTSAIEVLQSGREAFLLKDWLQALMVQSVDTGPADPDKPKTHPKSKASGSGKKKRKKKLDGFIVSSEEEDFELCELSDEDDDWAPSGSRGITRKTVVRSGNLAKGKEGDKTANALVISGPHGCGKTAAVYAVAKELDFEIFEINTSSRRSGKDVLEKIGDMTRNHHVQQHHSASTPDDQDGTVEDDTAKDIKSGKQSTMSTFFKPNLAKGKPKSTAKPSNKAPQQEIKKESPKSQRQSLILLEEVDILYEEDKQFWTTVVGLIAQSKRPFIMTCNDETLVPLHTLKLHGIFRLSVPPRDLAVDRLILVAANEGHPLTRDSVEQLFDSRHSDLRAATMDLQYWCQIGVGDRRGGFDWFYPRWPKGVDLDENKEVVRVVSQHTFRPGMNLLGRDSIADSHFSPRLVEDEILHQSWDSWQLDIGHWQDSVGLGAWAESVAPNITPSTRLGVLGAYDELAESLSAADLCSCRSFAAFKEEAVDTTQPDMPPKMRDDFVQGHTYIDTAPVTHFDSLTTSVASSIKSLAKSCLQLQTEKLQQCPVSTLRPLDERRAIKLLQTSFKTIPPGTPAIKRMDFAFAFDPIAAPDTSSLQAVSYLEPSVFDRTLKLIALDVAPYVRGIVAYDAQLQKQRLKLSSLVSEGGGGGARGAKRMRTTRAALSALEGGSRTTTRGERWFKADLNPYLVANTAGEGWVATAASESVGTPPAQGSAGSPRSSAGSSRTSPETTPTKTPKKNLLKGRKRKLLQDDEEADELGC